MHLPISAETWSGHPRPININMEERVRHMKSNSAHKLKVRHEHGGATVPRGMGRMAMQQTDSDPLEATWLPT